MRSDFINKRNINGRRRSLGETGETYTEYEMIVLPKFDTFIFHQPPLSPTSSENWNQRWNGVLQGAANPETSQEIPIGLLNPWNDGGPPSGPLAITVAPRTPTRSIVSFDLSAVPTSANITDARLNLTVSSKTYWDESNQGSGVVEVNSTPPDVSTWILIY